MTKTKKIIIGVLLIIGLLAVLYKPAMRYIIEGIFFAELIENPDHRMPVLESTHYYTNADGVRSDRTAEDFPKEDFNIIILGDSFVYGFMLNIKASLPRQFENKAREHFATDKINVANFGWTSSSPYLSYRLLKDIGDKYNPDVVLLSLDMTDYKDDYFYKSVLMQRGTYKNLVESPSLYFHIKKITAFLDPITGWHKDLFGYPSSSGYFVANQPMQKSLVYFDEVYDSLEQINDYVKDTWNIPFLVFVPPRHWQYTDKEATETWEQGFEVMGPYALENYKYFNARNEGTEFPIISLLNDFKETDQFPLNFTRDSHWNPTGAKFTAETMLKYCLELGCFAKLVSDQ